MNNAVALTEPEDYDRASLLPTREDVRRINEATHRRLNEQGDVRIQVGFFRCPWPCSKELYAKVRKAAIDRWVGYMEKTGWVLVSKVGVRTDKRRKAHVLRGDWYSVPSFDEVEIPVAAAFKKLNLQIVRAEIPISD